jgi:hypothetical protein
MFDRALPDLTFPGVAFGTHETPWDMRVYLYAGGAKLSIKKALGAIERGELGEPLDGRLNLIRGVHAAIKVNVEAGSSTTTIAAGLRKLKQFIVWAEGEKRSLALEDVRATFLAWADHLHYRHAIRRDLSPSVAYQYAHGVAVLLGGALGLHYPSGKGKSALLTQTRLRSWRSTKRVLGTESDKQNLESAFTFGRLLADMCEGLDLAAVRGPLPVILRLSDRRTLLLKSNKRFAEKPLSALSKANRSASARSRSALPPGAEIIGKSRESLLNQRVEAELLIFMSQTGMNLQQAFQLRREDYRWRTDGDDVIAYRVFKGRRHGEAVFRAFKVYRLHLERYRTWLKETGISARDERLFPLTATHMFRAENSPPALSATKAVCRRLGVRFHGPQALRATRLNWLLRRSDDPLLAAEMTAHTVRVSQRVYAQPHHQRATSEITRFHAASDPTLQSPGAGRCADGRRQPRPIPDFPIEAPEPDCANPEGCLFCVYHRDELSDDYCWRLASARYLKSLELALYRSSQRVPVHPATPVIERIGAKLRAIARIGEREASWVLDAEERVRLSMFHPHFEAITELAQVRSCA